MTLTLTLPFPDAKLNPNRSKGKHWASTYAARKVAREQAFLITRKAFSSNAGPSALIPLQIVFVQPDRRRRDRDNLLGALKPSLDGIADALGVNDSQFEPVTISREYGKQPGEVRISLW